MKFKIKILKISYVIFLLLNISLYSQNVVRSKSYSDLQSQSISVLPAAIVNVADYGAKGDGKTDDTKAIQLAINSGQPLKFNKGVFLVKNLQLPFSFKGLTIQGAGYNHWNLDSGTVLKAISKEPLLSIQNGCDFVKISDIRLEGARLSSIGIDGSFGASLIMENVGIYNFLQYGLKSHQGLHRINACFFGNNNIGIQLFSDSSLTNSEITGGEICLKIVAGGNRMSNLWLNGAGLHSILIEPFDEKTNLQNTSFNNLYVEDVLGKDQINYQLVIKGNSERRVQQLRIDNSFFAHVTNTKNPNSIIYLENADEIILSNNNILGQHTYHKGNTYTSNFIFSKNSNNVKISNNIIKGINNSAVIMQNSYDWSILGNDFIDCAEYNQSAVIQIIGKENSRALISNNRFINYSTNSSTFALKTELDKGFFFMNNLIVYPNISVVKNNYGENISTDKNYR